MFFWTHHRIFNRLGGGRLGLRRDAERLNVWLPSRRFLAALIACWVGGIVVIYAFGVPGIALRTELTLSKAAMASIIFCRVMF